MWIQKSGARQQWQQRDFSGKMVVLGKGDLGYAQEFIVLHEAYTNKPKIVTITIDLVSMETEVN